MAQDIMPQGILLRLDSIEPGVAAGVSAHTWKPPCFSSVSHVITHHLMFSDEAFNCFLSLFLAFSSPSLILQLVSPRNSLLESKHLSGLRVLMTLSHMLNESALLQ
jgi:hypothetical protein